MNYPPKHYQEKDFKNILHTIKTFPLATLISAKNNEVFTTHLPLMYSETEHGYGKLIGHIDKFNPHVALLRDNYPTTAIFHGPNAYMSPHTFENNPLPTWNYVKAHLQGNVTRIKDPKVVIESIVNMTSFLEASSSNPYTLHSNDTRVTQLVDYIIGFEIEITAWEGKFKLSQDKPKAHMELARAALIEKNKNDISAYLQEILPR